MATVVSSGEMSLGSKDDLPGGQHDEPAAVDQSVARRNRVERRYGALTEALAKRRDTGGGDPPTIDEVATAAVDSKSSGAPVDGSVRGKVESHVGASLENVRVHDDPLSQEATAAMGARAFTRGSDVFLGPGESGGNLELMAHELTHVVQQGAAGQELVQRQVQVGPATSPAETQADAVAAQVTGAQAPDRLLVDEGELQAGQMHTSAFMNELRQQVTAAADEALGPIWTALGCPYIEQWFSSHQSAGATKLEALARKYSGVPRASNARDYIAPICNRVRAGIGTWKNGGDVSGDLAAAGMASAADAAASSPRDEDGNPRPPVEHAAQRKPSGHDPMTPQSLVSELGDGEALSADTAARMGEAFGGEDFSDVRVHTGEQAARKAGELDARAFAVGEHVAFGPGEYQPGTLEGDAMLAHELAHTVQQRGATSESSAQRKPIAGESTAHEDDADRAAVGVLGRLWGGVKGAFGSIRENVGPALSSGYQLQRCPSGGTKPSYDWSDTEKGVNEQAVVAKLSKTPSMITPERNLVAGKTIGVFDSEAKALAVAKSEASPAVVIPENGKYVAYTLTSDGYFNDDIFNPTLIRNAGMFVQANISAIITAQGATYRTHDIAHAPGEVPRLETEPVGDPFQPFIDANKEGKGGIDALDEGSLLGMFRAAMHDNAIAVLAESERQAEQKAAQFKGGTSAVSKSEQDLMLGTAQELLPVLEELQSAEGDLFIEEQSGGGEPDWDQDPSEPTDLEKLQKKVDDLKGKKARIVARYPMLGRYDKPKNLKKFIGGGPSARISALASDANQVVSDIWTTRHAIESGDLNLWTVPSVLYSTMVGLGIKEGSQQHTWITNKAKAQKSKENFLNIAMAVFSIGFGIAAAVFSGGTSLAFAAGAFGVGIVDAIETTEQHFVKNAATNTDVDTPETMLDASVRQHWGWLVVAWAGVALDFADVLKAAKVGEEISKVAKGGRTLDEAAQALANGNPKLLERLRKAAGVHKIDDVVTADILRGLEPQVGARIEIDPKALGKTSSEVRVNVQLVKNRLIVTGITVGPMAKVGDILLHAETVRLLERYSGVSGKIRELWDKFRSFAKIGDDANVPPSAWAKNSQAYLSWFEVKKLQGIVDVKRAELQELLRKGAPQAQQDSLRREIAFLENEHDIHRRVVEQASQEVSDDMFVAMGTGTKEALQSPAGLRLPDFPHVGPDADPTVLKNALENSAYYYRREGGGFTLVRKAGKDGKAIEPEIIDGKWTGKWLDKAETMSRLEREAHLVASWPEKLQDAYKALHGTHSGSKVVPVEGVKALGTKISKLDPDFIDDCIRILEPAYTRMFDGDAVKGAAKAREVAGKIAEHDLTLVKGTEHIRAAHGYRSSFFKGLKDDGLKATEGGEVHHLIPIYLGGDHKLLLDLEPKLHDKMHSLIDRVPFQEGTLAPSSIRSAGLPFDKGAAVVQGNAVQLYKAVESGGEWKWVAIGGGA